MPSPFVKKFNTDDDLVDVVSQYDQIIEGALSSEPKVVDVPMDPLMQMEAELANDPPQLIDDKAPLRNDAALEAMRAKESQEDDLARTLSEYDKAMRSDQIEHGINRAEMIWSGKAGPTAPSQAKAVLDRQNIANDRRALDLKGQPKPAKQESESVAEKNKSQAELNRAKAANEKLKPGESEKDRQARLKAAGLRSLGRSRADDTRSLALSDRRAERQIPGWKWREDKSGKKYLPTLMQKQKADQALVDYGVVEDRAVPLEEMLSQEESVIVPYLNDNWPEFESQFSILYNSVNQLNRNGVMNVHDLEEVKKQVGEATSADQFVMKGGLKRLRNAIKQYRSEFPKLMSRYGYEPGDEDSMFEEGKSRSIVRQPPEAVSAPETGNAAPIDTDTEVQESALPQESKSVLPGKTYTVTSIDPSEDDYGEEETVTAEEATRIYEEAVRTNTQHKIMLNQVE